MDDQPASDIKNGDGCKADPPIPAPYEPEKGELPNQKEMSYENKFSGIIKLFFEWLRSTDWLIAIATVVIAVATAINAGLVCLQWREMQSSGIDTHTLAEATDKLAKAAKAQSESIADQLRIMKIQLDDAKEASARINRPHFVVGNFHIWEEGKGRLLNANDEFPTWRKGIQIEGAVIATNNGYVSTIITGYCLPHWTSGRLQMINPGWGADPSKQMWEGFDQSKTGNPVNLPPYNQEIRPGTSAKCSIKTTVGDGDLYIIGAIGYLDDLRKTHHVHFARKYIPNEKRFEAVEDPTYEYED